MTSTSTIQIPQHSEGRTVRDVVEYQHALVNEVWCRKIFRQVLQSLEAQYAAHMPHRAITPDTIVFQENGEPMLLPSPYVSAEPGLANDLRALAAVIHYAITLELAPGAPLRGRRLEGFSESLLGAVDKCLSADPLQRPQTIDQLRNLLGIVALGPPVPVTPRSAGRQPHAVPPAVHEAQAAPAPQPWRRGEPLGRLQRWLLIGLATLVLLAAAMALVALLRGTASRDAVVLSLPPAARAPQGFGPGSPPATPALAPPAARQADVPAVAGEPAMPAAAANPAGDANDPGPALPVTGRSAAGAEQSAAAQPVRAPETQRAPASRAASSTAGYVTYKLRVKPWGTVYVDGEERGVSPPLKRLALAPGQHTVRLVNPNFRDRVLRIDVFGRRPGTIAHDFSAE